MFFIFIVFYLLHSTFNPASVHKLYPIANQTVSRVCGSVRIALNVCITAFAERRKELSQSQQQQSAPQGGSAAAAAAASPGPATASAGGGGGGYSSSASPCGGAVSKASATGSFTLLLTVAAAKKALNRYLQQGPEQVWGAGGAKVPRAATAEANEATTVAVTGGGGSSV